MAGTETEAHRSLSRLAFQWAQQEGYPICGMEVRVPHSGYRADVAAYRPEYRKLPLAVEGKGTERLVQQPVIGTTAIFECKQARSDFLKDSHSAAITIEKLKVLDARRQTLERLLGVHQPSLRKGESLFAEYDVLDMSHFEHKTYGRVVREIQILQARLYGKTKFEKLMKYRCANLCYLVVEDGILQDHEAPLLWGLLMRRGDGLVLEKKPVWNEVTESARLLLLQRIAIGGTKRLNREWGDDQEKAL
jgi:hypothetical protein